jgi:pantothenate kinase
LEDLASQTYKEYELNIKGVKEVFNQFIFEHMAEDKTSSDVTAELKKMLDLRFKNDAPRRPPRIIIMGPPGSGRSTQAKLMAD